jgi:hypothetical protein
VVIFAVLIESPALCAHQDTEPPPCTSATRLRPGGAYLQIVESSRGGDQVNQQVIATLGRFDELQASGQLTAASPTAAQPPIRNCNCENP